MLSFADRIGYNTEQYPKIFTVKEELCFD